MPDQAHPSVRARGWAQGQEPPGPTINAAPRLQPRPPPATSPPPHSGGGRGVKLVWIEYLQRDMLVLRFCLNEQKCCTRQSLRRMVCAVLLVQVDRSREPTLAALLSDSSKREARVLHKHPNPDHGARIPKRVGVKLESAAPNLNHGLTRITGTSRPKARSRAPAGPARSTASPASQPEPRTSHKTRSQQVRTQHASADGRGTCDTRVLRTSGRTLPGQPT